MKPIRPEGCNFRLRGGGAVPDLECRKMPDGSLVSCWQLDSNEVRRLLFSKKLYLQVIGPHPAVRLTVEEPWEEGR